jgi:hypothetical protein
VIIWTLLYADFQEAFYPCSLQCRGIVAFSAADVRLHFTCKLQRGYTYDNGRKKERKGEPDTRVDKYLKFIFEFYMADVSQQAYHLVPVAYLLMQYHLLGIKPGSLDAFDKLLIIFSATLSWTHYRYRLLIF